MPEEMNRYIESVTIPDELSEKYDMTIKEALEIAHTLPAIEAVAIAFGYGRAMGYKAAFECVGK